MGVQLLKTIFIVLTFLQQYQLFSLLNEDNAINTRPLRYDLSIQIFPDEDRFSGEVVISVFWTETTNVVTLNAHESLTINTTQVIVTKSNDSKAREEINVQKTEKLFDTSTLNFALERPLDAGTICDIKLTFYGEISSQNKEGLFKKSFTEASSEKPKWIIASNLQQGNASLVFPCYDNPAFKTHFSVNIQRPSNVNTLSTMSKATCQDMGNGWVKDIYLESPPMVVNSLAIFVSDFTPLTYNESGIQLRIWSAPELSQTIIHNRSDLIFNSLKTFAKVFGVPYPLKKLDYVALPSSMAINIQESWGLIVSSNTNLGNNEARERSTILNEMGNQWIGNLVTPASNENKSTVSALLDFCSMFYDTTESVTEPKTLWQKWPLLNIYADYYELGSPTLSDNARIRQMSVLSHTQLVYRMLAYILTEKTFLTALHKFVKEKQYKTFEIDDFWDILTKQAHADGNLPIDKTVNEIALSWIEKSRLPLVTATRNYGINSVQLEQSLFIRKRPRYVVKDEEDMLWTIPIVLKTQDNLNFTDARPSYWMKEKEFAIEDAPGVDKFIIINPEEIASFMVNYDEKNWNLLADFLRSGDKQRALIPPITRAKLVHDALNLAYAGTLDFGTALNMTLYLKDETEYIPWKPFFNMFDHISRHISGTKVLKKFETFVSILIGPLYDRLKASENQYSEDFISEVEGVLRNVGNEKMLKEANIVYDKWMQDTLANYKAVGKYICMIYAYGTKEQWEFGLKTLMTSDGKSHVIRYFLFKSLVGCAKDSWKIRKILNITLFDQKDAFTDDDFNYAVFMLTGNAIGYTTTFQYLRDNWIVLRERLNQKPEIWKQLIYTATNLYITQEGLKEVTDLYYKYRGLYGVAEKTIEDGIKKAKEEVKWSNENLRTLEEWLDNYIFKNSPQK